MKAKNKPEPIRIFESVLRGVFDYVNVRVAKQGY